ncbi:MAG: DoxX protein [Bacteroidota bacterium]|nr:DoxX protein [Bacteroidota bacterium]
MLSGNRFSIIYLRVALAAGFLSAVASRLSLWGKHSSGWKGFVEYTAQVNSFLPSSWAATIAVISTVLETALAVMLLTGIQLKRAAFAAGVLTGFFALAMAISSGIKEPLDYSVFAFSAGSFLLSGTTMLR